jgi:Fe-Mn family superoxide dismutase
MDPHSEGASMTIPSGQIAPAEAGAPVFELPPLPYDLRALEPVLSAETLDIHHGRHHARYVETLNRLLPQQNLSADTLEDVIRAAHRSDSRSVFNNAAQAWNHAFFWESMRPKASEPGGLLCGAITSSFGGADALAQRFVAKGTGHFGSGWVWLVATEDGLEVITTHDADTPIVAEGVTPLLACDVWEHAYYVDYRQDRASWLTIWWHKLANWHFAGCQYGARLGHGQAWRYPAPTHASGE